jgi:hypothetical protein
MLAGCVVVDMDQGNRRIEEVGKGEGTGEQRNDGSEVVKIPSQTLK